MVFFLFRLCLYLPQKVLYKGGYKVYLQIGKGNTKLSRSLFFTNCSFSLLCKKNQDVDEDKLNHKIPHRFEPITNIGANWCCHCGYMLSLGSRSAKKCSGKLDWICSLTKKKQIKQKHAIHHGFFIIECGITCHIKCSHLVPDFCGLSMEMANQMLAEIKAARRKTGDGSSASLLPGGKSGQGSKTDSSGKADEQLSNQLSQVNIGSDVLPSPSTSTNANPYAPIPNTARLSGSHQSPSLPPKHDVAPVPSTSTSATTAVSTTRRVTLDDFSFLAVLGKGNFGKVRNNSLPMYSD